MSPVVFIGGGGVIWQSSQKREKAGHEESILRQLNILDWALSHDQGDILQ